jgi:hypothetical protein
MGPVLRLERHVFVHHRHASPFGAGWGILQVGRLFRDPSADQAVLAHGNGFDESFVPRTTTTRASLTTSSAG